jgi:hypothetical protein
LRHPLRASERDEQQVFGFSSRYRQDSDPCQKFRGEKDGGAVRVVYHRRKKKKSRLEVTDSRNFQSKKDPVEFVIFLFDGKPDHHAFFVAPTHPQRTGQSFPSQDLFVDGGFDKSCGMWERGHALSWPVIQSIKEMPSTKETTVRVIGRYQQRMALYAEATRSIEWSCMLVATLCYYARREVDTTVSKRSGVHALACVDYRTDDSDP